MGIRKFIKDIQRSFTENVMKRSYEGADRGRRGNNTPRDRGSATKGIGVEAADLRKRARYLYKNTFTAKRAVNGIAYGVIGGGITPSFNIGGLTDSPQIQRIKTAWEDWADKKTCDFYGKLNFYGLQELITKTVMRDGECFVVKRRVKSKKNTFGIQLQVLEMEYLAEYVSYEMDNGGGWTYNGIEYDSDGIVAAYWLHPRHPEELYQQPVRISAEDVLHIYEVDFPGQGRGVTRAASTMISERDLSDYNDSELMAKKVQASYAIFRTTADPAAAENVNPADYDSEDDLETIRPGSIYRITPGETIQAFTPPSAQGAEEYRKSKYMEIAGGYEVTYEMLRGDYSNVNFSSGRMGWIEHSRVIQHVQLNCIIPQLCESVSEWFLEQLLIAPGGVNRLPNGLQIKWTPPKREMIDPVKETAAVKDKLRTGLGSYRDAIQSMGGDPNETIKEIAEDVAMFKKHGLHPEWFPDLDPEKKEVFQGKK